ncbi:MAG TPA: hypothetical protein VGE35_02045 [Candidatus Paceibacterota bacterium]
MVVELSLLAVSFAAMTAIIVHKRYESSRGVKTPIHAVRAKADPVLHDVHHKTRRFVSYLTIKNGVLLANYIFVHVVRFLMHFSHKVHKASSDVVTKASQKKEDLVRGGAASFYLKKVKEGAKAGGEGKIEETVTAARTEAAAEDALDNK